ncbi:MAG: hypothetical protein Q8K85_02775, partial [Hyphomicrobium sp.]|nr:hypothetical protein [Hyphomicrobium sp.]
RQFASAVDAQAVADICRQLTDLVQAKPAEAAVVAVAAQAPQAVPAALADAGPVDPSPENLYAILTGTVATGPVPAAGMTSAPAAAATPEPGKVAPTQGSADAGGAEGYGFFAETAPPVASSTNLGRRATDVAEDAPPKRGRRASDRADAETTSIRVGVEKVDQLINLVGELVITQAMLAQTASRVDTALYEALRTGLGQLEHNTRDLQESVMSIRMMPISFVFSRFPRVVRDLAGKLGKQVELKTVGEGTELDKGLIEKIADPLNHLVRNSLDHGIESPEKRVAAGKPAIGTITLRAFHQGGNIVIEVGDDGAGLNRAKILAKARERGLAVSDAMSDQEVWQLIFEAGFSTAEVVTA